MESISEILRAVETGDRAGIDRLEAVYNELRSLAKKHMSRERRDHTLQTTALVHEAYIKLLGRSAPMQDEGHFYRAAAQAMRQILIDHARGRATERRGGGALKQTIDACDVEAPSRQADLETLDEPLRELELLAPRHAEIARLRFVDNESEREIAKILDISERTVRRDLAAAKLWLYDRIKPEGDKPLQPDSQLSRNPGRQLGGPQ
ncbi:MAG TPA: ECF-type sigma factor [Tepidisphaeraceae bacterium]|nr:ECF-type sigma factor [Tepidisphaeraceae bacterium]